MNKYENVCECKFDTHYTTYVAWTATRCTNKFNSDHIPYRDFFFVWNSSTIALISPPYPQFGLLMILMPQLASANSSELALTQLPDALGPLFAHGGVWQNHSPGYLCQSVLGAYTASQRAVMALSRFAVSLTTKHVALTRASQTKGHLQFICHPPHP